MFVLIIALILFIINIVVEPRQYLNVFLLAVIIFLGSTYVLDIFIPIYNTHGRLNIFYYLLFAFIFPLVLIIAFIMTLINTRQIINKEGKSLTNLLVFSYGAYILFNFIIINYQPSFLYSFKEGIIPIFLTTIFIYINIIFITNVIYTKILTIIAKRKKPSYIIVLGSGLIEDRVPPLLQSRLDKGIEVYNRYDNIKMIVSGGQGNDELVSEAEAMCKYLLTQNIPKEDIWVENQSTTTFENLTYSQNIIKKGNDKNPHIRVVSNNFHILRVAFITKKIKLNASVEGSHTASYFYPNAIAREFIACFMMFRKSHMAMLFFIILSFIWLLIS